MSPVGCEEAIYQDVSVEMLKLRKTIDFNLLGEESEADRGSGVMDLEDDLSEETSPSPPPLKLARINISNSSEFSSPPCSTPLSRAGPFFCSPSPTQTTARLTRLFSKPVRKSISKLPTEKSQSSVVLRKCVGSVNTNPFTPAPGSHQNRKRLFSR